MSEQKQQEQLSPQERVMCCCPSWTHPKECIEIRYGDNEYDEECECCCHAQDDDDD